MSNWTLFSNHGHVLVVLAQDPDARLRDVAASVGVTERAVQKIVRDLQEGGILSVSRHGRRNRYRIHTRKHLRHALEAHVSVGELMAVITAEVGTSPQPERAPERLPERAREPAAKTRLPAASETPRTQAAATARSTPAPAPANADRAAARPTAKPVNRRAAKRKGPGEGQGSLF